MKKNEHQVRYVRDIAQSDWFITSSVKNHINVSDIFHYPDTLYPKPSPIARGDFSLVWEGGSHAIHFRCFVCHMARCATITYPNVTAAALRLRCECAMQAIVRGWSSCPSRNRPCRTTGHNPTHSYGLTWGAELGHHSPVDREAPGRVGTYQRSIRGRRREHLLSVFSSQRKRVIYTRNRSVTSLLITL